MFDCHLHVSALTFDNTRTHTSHDFMCSCCLPQTGSDASSQDDVDVTQFAKGVRVNILDRPGGIIVGTILVKDAQPAIPTGWNDLTTKVGDYVIVSYRTAKITAAAKSHVAEKEDWAHYLRLDWTQYNKKDDDDYADADADDDDDEGGWEMTLKDIVDEGADFLIYREFLSLITPKTKKKGGTKPRISKLGTNVVTRGGPSPKKPRARDNTGKRANKRNPPRKRQ